MKLYTTIKTGYTAGIYGCSGEYFTTTVIDSEQRINSLLEEKGYKYVHSGGSYGRLTRKDIPSKWYMSEYTAIEYIKTNIN